MPPKIARNIAPLDVVKMKDGTTFVVTSLTVDPSGVVRLFNGDKHVWHDETFGSDEEIEVVGRDPK